MEKVSVAQNVGSLGLSRAEAQELLANIVNIISGRVTPYCWKLVGDDPDSLHNLLDVTRDEMDKILQACGIFGAGDSRVKLRIFEDFTLKFEGHDCVCWQMYRPIKAYNAHHTTFMVCPFRSLNSGPTQNTIFSEVKLSRYALPTSVAHRQRPLSSARKVIIRRPFNDTTPE